MLNILYNSIDKTKIFIVNEIIKNHAIGFNLRTENLVSEKLNNLEKTTVDIFNYVNDNNTIALLALYFNKHGYCYKDISDLIGISNRTLLRYISATKID